MKGYHPKRKRKTHCLRGHPLSGDNIWKRERANGTMEHRCRACHAIYSRRRAERDKAERGRIKQEESDGIRTR